MACSDKTEMGAMSEGAIFEFPKMSSYREDSVNIYEESLKMMSNSVPDAKEQLHLSESETIRSSKASGHRKRSSRKSRSASKAHMTESDSEILDSVLSVLETTLSQSGIDAHTSSKRHVKRSASAMSSAMLQSGGYFVDEHGDLRQSASRAASSSRPRSYSASRAGCRDSGAADHLRLSIVPEEGHKRQKHDSLVPSVALKAPNQPPKFTNFLRAHHAVPFEMNTCKTAHSRTTKSGPIATGGITSPTDIKQLLFRDDLQTIKGKNIIAQRSVLSVSAEHTQAPERSSSSRHVVRPITKEFNVQSVRAVKPVSLAQLYNKPVKNTDSTLRSTSTSSFLTQPSGSSSSLHEQQSFTADEAATLLPNQVAQPLKQPNSGKLVFKGLKLLRPTKSSENGSQMLVQQVEFSEHSARVSEASAPDVTGRASFSESSFVDVDIIQVPAPPSRKSAETANPVAAESATLSAEDFEQSGVLLLNPKLVTFPHPQKPAEGDIVESGSAQFQVLTSEASTEDTFDMLRKEFIALGVRLAQLANRRSYVESALSSYEKFASDGNADHSYLTSEIGEAQRKLDAIENEMTQILAKRADLRQHFADAGINIQTEVINERQLRKTKIDQALLLELNPLEAAHPSESSFYAETLNNTWIADNQTTNAADSCNHGTSLCEESLHMSLQGTHKPNVPRPQLPVPPSTSVKDMAVGESIRATFDDATLAIDPCITQEDQRSDSTEVGLQVIESVNAQRVSVSDTIEHISQIIGSQCVDAERRKLSMLMTVLLTAFRNPNDASAYSKENITAYTNAINSLDSSNSEINMKAALPASAELYSVTIVQLMRGVESFLRTGQSTILMHAVVTSRRRPGWTHSPILKLLASILEIMSLHTVANNSTVDDLDACYSRTAHSGCAWIISELLVLLRHSVRSMDDVSVEDIHQLALSMLAFAPRVSSEVSQRWHKELHAIVSAEPQLQRYVDLQEALLRGKENIDTVGEVGETN